MLRNGKSPSCSFGFLNPHCHLIVHELVYIYDLLIYNFLFIQDYLKSYFPCSIKMANSIRLYHGSPLLYVRCVILQYGVPSFIACRILITFLRCKNVRNHHVAIGIQLSQNFISVLIDRKRNKTKMIYFFS